MSYNWNSFNCFTTPTTNLELFPYLKQIYSLSPNVNLLSNYPLIDVYTPGFTKLSNLATEFHDDLAVESVENIRSAYTTVVPHVRLYYPEPFLASPTFMHTDLSYLFMFQYQFWLWFLFIFLIIFFLLSFLSLLRWCNHRTQPRRETRGVSRSKCGDFITATVPVTWAMSIIVTESTDATDYYDNFGTSEIMIGVRAFQWGWEYYYPKSVDLNYNIRPSYSTFIGNSLKYNTSTGRTLNTNQLWRFYQQKVEEAIVTPAHLLILPTDNLKFLKFLNCKFIGRNIKRESTAFKQVRRFSKTYTSNLVHTPSVFTDKYVKLNHLFNSDNQLTTSFSYGVQRQHNFTSSSAVANINATFLDQKSFNKFLNYTQQYSNTTNHSYKSLWNHTNRQANTSIAQTSTNFIQKINLLHPTTLFNNHQTVDNTTTPLTNLLQKNKIFNIVLTYPSLIKTFSYLSSDNLDVNPLRTLKNFNLTNENLLAQNTPATRKIFNQINNVIPNLNPYNLPSVNVYPKGTVFTNTLVTPAKFSKTPLNTISPQKSSLDTGSQLNPHHSYVTLSQGSNVLDSNMTKLFENTTNTLPYNYFLLKKTTNNDITVFNKLSSTETHFTKGLAPLFTNDPLINTVNFDSTNEIKNTTLSSIQSTTNLNHTRTHHVAFNSTPDIISDPVGENLQEVKFYRNFWKTFTPNVATDLRLNKLLNSTYNKTWTNWALPAPGLNYIDRNRGLLFMLTDTYWEFAQSWYEQFEYRKINDSLTQAPWIDVKMREGKQSGVDKLSQLNPFISYYTNDSDYMDEYVGHEYKLYDRSLKHELIQSGDEINSSNNPLWRPWLKDMTSTGLYYTNSLVTEDFFNQTSLITKHDFNIFPLINLTDELEESYTDYKYLTQLFVNNATINLNLPRNFLTPMSYVNVLNKFREDFDEFNWYTPINNSMVASVNNLSQNWLDLESRYNTNVSHSSDLISLRASAKNSIQTYNAYRTVFRSRYDRGWSFAKLESLANLQSPQPMITDNRPSFTSLLGKTKEHFYNSHLYINNTLPVFNELTGLFNTNNYYFYEFPFLISRMSSGTLHTWFDWYAKWSRIEVQYSDLSKVTAIATRRNRKSLELSGSASGKASAKETYSLRLANIRNNYYPLWLGMPTTHYLNTAWQNSLLFLQNTLDSTLSVSTNPTIIIGNGSNKTLLDYIKTNCKWVFNRLEGFDDASNRFTPQLSMEYRNFWRPYTSIHAQSYNLTRLVGILSKREYIYRKYLEVNNKIIYLPHNFTANPNHPLIELIRSSFLLTNPITYMGELSRDFYITSSQYFQFLLFRIWIQNTATLVENYLPISLPLINEYLFFYFCDTSNSLKGNSADLYKNPYRPLKKGIQNMLRLHATGAVAMPIEIRLQIMASSRDVIHSWAIPSASIKIDCVPGYTSHRIMIFFTPGIYWGQCQEICGRFHHWMPIIVYFMKRDLFFLWCTHFMLRIEKKDRELKNPINDNLFASYIRFASYDRYSWLTELSQHL